MGKETVWLLASLSIKYKWSHEWLRALHSVLAVFGVDWDVLTNVYFFRVYVTFAAGAWAAWKV